MLIVDHHQHRHCCFFILFYFIFKLYIIVLVLPNIRMNPPQAYMCSPSWHCFYCSKNFLLELPLYPLTHFLLPYSEFTLVFAREVAFLCCSGIWKYEYPWLAGQIGWKKLAMNDWGMSGAWSWCHAVDSALWWRQTVRGLIHPASPAHKLVPDVLWITRETPCL